MIPKTSLEQWAAFKAVVDEGSFAKAAERLHKSQSSVSYSVARLQERLPSSLLVQQGRKAELTELGKTLYRHASNLLEQAAMLDRTAQYLAQGWEAEVTLAVDALADRRQIFCALNNFSQAHPQTRIRILETTLSGSEEALITRDADIVILHRVPPGFLGSLYEDVEMVPVAHPQHPLFNHGQITEEILKQQRQLVVRDSGTKRNQDGGWLGAEQRWTVSHFSTSVHAIKEGLGFGFVPRPMVQEELARGVLKILPLAYGQVRKLSLYLVLADQSHAGQATQAVSEYLLNA